MRSGRNAILGIAVLLFFALGTANAGTITFNFNPTNGQSVQSYLTAALNAQVSGATVTASTGNIAPIWGGTYSGDGHVVGKNCKGTNCSTTLGSDEGKPLGGSDNFLINNHGKGDYFTLTFTNVQFNQVSFDLEIFPDASCTVLSKRYCGGNPTNGIYPNQPDFTLLINGTQSGHWYGLKPGSGGDASTYTKSQVSTSEVTPQLLLDGSNRITVDFTPNGKTTVLTFKDWPATIGIDNLTLTQTPEPATCLLLGSGLVGMLLRKKALKK